MKSTYDLLSQEATSHLQSIDRIFAHLQKVYQETGDEDAKMAMDSLRGNLRTCTFLGPPATGKNMLKKEGNTFQGPPASNEERFTDRVKCIISRAATKNGQRIETSARGHAGAYLFYIDAEAFCKAIDRQVVVCTRARAKGIFGRNALLCTGDKGLPVHRPCGEDEHHQRLQVAVERPGFRI